jgi:CheY-like chemotaxis protein
MIRPTILVAEPEPANALSVRKLVLETAKFNVLTVHSTQEALDTLRLFPNLHLAVLVMDGVIDVEGIAATIKEQNPKTPVIAATPRVGEKSQTADLTVSSYEPEELLNVIRSLLGDPRKPSEVGNRQFPEHGDGSSADAA